LPPLSPLPQADKPSKATTQIIIFIVVSLKLF